MGGTPMISASPACTPTPALPVEGEGILLALLTGCVRNTIALWLFGGLRAIRKQET
jgi:hypothetical protein